MEVLAIIPARGGSKGIPRKNLQLLVGKPLLAHTIEQALAAKTVTRVVVSTDDEEIAAVAQEYGAQTVKRPTDISGDTASSEAALLHTLNELAEKEGYSPDLLVFLQCTSPLRGAADIDGGVSRLLDESGDCLLGVTPFSLFLWRATPAGDAEGINHDKRHRPMRQEMEPQYMETGVLYVMRTAGFQQAKHRFFGKTLLYEMPAERCLDINDRVDLVIAEAVLGQRQPARA